MLSTLERILVTHFIQPKGLVIAIPGMENFITIKNLNFTGEVSSEIFEISG